ncbi:AbrB/MazE/SpoVT family DNA-binding domain-containing protein [Candidatus Nitrosocosmicus agrestis]|jgi:antitoxin component of MazEF toxin-antitoxin module|uniref:AbrB/MazE/SpoVT family DNA-binding domain-containing protein n=1 Tax=Candidatus Nitrosocosmicus agrestis TaxID=2563600 RepID=UPI00122DF880|nr:AbrB/MazE/SpoVT family DNA-binding domain-containing protein [Candidatus Nitrosocosmicus sp. SS]KAA2283095.1 AbrB/MazE/SpoVT family DNA-binding domain-containing protein [Candidatus Nitrosocosmicus sp. SS]KAF0868551.1 AbrB/MazE/SpoVT family DNA-binding domain-containing protein [Candidatus Nitrosocosmicus sp. SS]
MRNTYLLQPYEVGAKNAKSLALVIPSAIVKKYQINPSTGFALKYDESKIVLQFVERNKKTMPDETSFKPESSSIDYQRRH